MWNNYDLLRKWNYQKRVTQIFLSLDTPHESCDTVRMNKQNKLSLKDFEELTETQLGVFVVVISDTIEVLENVLATDDDKMVREHLEVLKKTQDKIKTTITDNDDFWKESAEITQILNLCDSFTKEERNEVLFSLATFLSDLEEAMQESRGKILKKQEKMHSSVLDILNEIQDNFKTFAAEDIFYDTLSIVLKELLDLYSDETMVESDEDKKWYKEALSNAKFFTQKLTEFDKTKPFDENLFALYDSIDENKQEFLYMEITDFGIDLLSEKLVDLQDEYEGLDVDLSKHEDNLAAIKQVKRKLQKKV